MLWETLREGRPITTTDECVEFDLAVDRSIDPEETLSNLTQDADMLQRILEDGLRLEDLRDKYLETKEGKLTVEGGADKR